MKSFIVSIILFAMLCCAITANSVYVSSSCEDMKLCAASVSSGNGSTPSELEALWTSHRYLFSFSVSEAKIERMDELIASLIFAYSANDSREVARLCLLIEALCEDIAIYERITLESIF